MPYNQPGYGVGYGGGGDTGPQRDRITQALMQIQQPPPAAPQMAPMGMPASPQAQTQPPSAAMGAMGTGMNPMGAQPMMPQMRAGMPAGGAMPGTGMPMQQPFGGMPQQPMGGMPQQQPLPGGY